VVVVADCFNHRLVLWRLDDGTVWKCFLWKVVRPLAVAVTGAGALVVTDEYRVQVLTVEGAVLSVLDPSAVAGVGQLGRDLWGVAVCTGTDEVFITDTKNHRVVALAWSPPANVRL
jgi:hypothetical protein